MPLGPGEQFCISFEVYYDLKALNLEFLFSSSAVTAVRRIWVLVISNLLSFPFAAGVVLLDTPYGYMSLFGMYIFSEMWISVAVTLLIDLSPPNMRATVLSIYYFLIGYCETMEFRYVRVIIFWTRIRNIAVVFRASCPPPC